MTVALPTYVREIEAWHAQAEARLRADDGWLTLAGLFWLREGTNTIGSDASSDIVLPDSAPAHVGRIDFDGSVATLAVAPGVEVHVNGASVTQQMLRSDAEGAPDIVTLGNLSWLIIKRGARTGVRLRDKNSPVREAFGGRVWFPVDETYRFDATFVPYDPPKMLAITNILGDTSDVASPGYVAFSHEGQTYQLDASSLESDGLHFVFRDRTSGHETYGAARFLTVPAPVNGRIELDFNRAVNPPCAFTVYATCPLPPRQNHLPFPVFAGERYNTSEGHG